MVTSTKEILNGKLLFFVQWVYLHSTVADPETLLYLICNYLRLYSVKGFGPNIGKKKYIRDKRCICMCFYLFSHWCQESLWNISELKTPYVCMFYGMKPAECGEAIYTLNRRFCSLRTIVEENCNLLWELFVPVLIKMW